MIALNKVVLPAPFGPIRPQMPPSCTSSDAPLSTEWSPYPAFKGPIRSRLSFISLPEVKAHDFRILQHLACGSLTERLALVKEDALLRQVSHHLQIVLDE